VRIHGSVALMGPGFSAIAEPREWVVRGMRYLECACSLEETLALDARRQRRAKAALDAVGIEAQVNCAGKSGLQVDGDQ
jgi:hypothetical protein